jgi:hypothetical protein
VLQYEQEGHTPQKHWTDYSRLLTAGPEAHKTFREFNKLLQRTVNHVLEVDQRFTIFARFTKKGRFFDQLRFDIGRRAQQTLPLAPVPSDLVDKLCSFGMARSQAEKLCRDYPRHRIEANFEYCLQQKREGAIKKTTGGFLHSAILTNYAKAPLNAVPPIPPSVTDTGRASGEVVSGWLPRERTDTQRELLRKLPLSARRGMLQECMKAMSSLECALLPRELDAATATEVQLVDPRVESALLNWWNHRPTLHAQAGRLSMPPVVS